MSYDYEVSAPAFNKAKVNITATRQYVLDAVKFLSNKYGKCNDRQIAKYLEWPINRVTGRRGELVNGGIIEPAGKHYDPVSKLIVNYWRPAGEVKQTELF